MSKSRKIEFKKFINELEYELFIVGKYKIDTIKDYLVSLDIYLNEKSLEVQEKISEYQSTTNILDSSVMTIYIEEYQDFNKSLKKVNRDFY